MEEFYCTQMVGVDHKNNDERDGMRRRSTPTMKAERVAAFRKKVQKEVLLHGRKRKDDERRRMEEYRRLCEAEGIHSKRLEEYDTLRKKASESLNERLQSIDYDQSLTNTEKKKRKFNMKRKFAAQTMGELVEKHEKHHNALTKAAKTQEKRQEEFEAAKAAKRERQEMKLRRVEERRATAALYAQRTRKGQPVMSGRVQSLLNKLQGEQPSK